MKFEADNTEHILVRGVNWLGDAVMSTPALLRLREARPAAHITLLTPAKLVDLWPHHPALDAVISIRPGEGAWSVAQKLRRERFDLALVLPNSPRSALETWLAGISSRIGYAAKWRRWLLTQIVPPRNGAIEMRKRSVREIKRRIESPKSSDATPNGTNLPPAVHHIQQYLHLTAALGANPAPLAPHLEVTDDEIAETDAMFRGDMRRKLEKVLPPDRIVWLGLNPSAEYGPAKRWPVEKYVAAAREISKRVKNCVWLIFGGASDAPLAEEIARSLGACAVNLAGKTSLRELMALLKRCEVLLTNDTGPMHVAAALGTPVVALFGSTSASLTGPGLPQDPRNTILSAGAPCSPCFLRKCPIDFRCMAGVQVEQVVRAVQAGLRSGRS
ncbi:MAG: glycosyltransferase family 9 protein [Verrucomicrobia bacterium]|nr:glycosyltransferase family 9 protein [Verrucomicrobiota bacterium]